MKQLEIGHLNDRNLFDIYTLDFGQDSLKEPFYSMIVFFRIGVAP